MGLEAVIRRTKNMLISNTFRNILTGLAAIRFEIFICVIFLLVSCLLVHVNGKTNPI